jgi:adenylyltransferase/sulfurtransferase
MVPNCATAGVLGVLPGTVGCIQATETVKALIGKGNLLDGRMVFYDALEMEFDTVEITKKDDCPVCGDDPAIDSVHDVEYTASCAIDAGSAAEPEMSVD